MGTAPDSTSAEVRSGRVTGPWHAAFAYSSPGELAGLLAGPVGAAVAAGDQVTAVVQDEVGHLLRAELGDAAGRVEFPPPREVHTVPAFTPALRWARAGAGTTRLGTRTLIVGQQLVDLPECGSEYWLRLCLGLEVCAPGLPLTVLCPFPDEDGSWLRVRPTHQVLGAGAAVHPNPAYRAPGEVVREHPTPPRPELGPPTAELRFRGTDLAPVRHLTAELGERAGLGPDRVADAVLAVNELAANSIEHGAGHGWLRLWVGGARRVVAEVADGGRLTDPFPGMVRPHPGSPRGRGLWLASELSDVMEVWTDGDTVIRVSWLR